MRDEALVDEPVPHRPSVGDQVYDYNRRAKHQWPDNPCQPNGYIKEIVDSGLVVAAFYDEPLETDVQVRIDEMDWQSEHKRWYIYQRPSTYFRDRLIVMRARKAGLIPSKEIP